MKKVCEVFIIAMDVIDEQDGTIKILEIQNAYESNTERAVELTKRDPINKLISTIKQSFRDVVIHEPMRGLHVSNLSKPSDIKDFGVVPNRGIEAFGRMKWLFYGVCNSHQHLKKYIPETHIRTLSTISKFDIQMLKHERYLFKPADMARGDGILQLDQKFETGAKLCAYLEKNTILKHEKEIAWRKHTPFIVQRYHHTNNVSKPVIRVYAAVVVISTGVVGEKLQIQLAVELKSAYRHIRIKQDPLDFTLANNRHEACDITYLRDPINTFLKDFFNTLLMQQQRVTYRYWEKLIKQYIKTHKCTSENERMLLVSQIARAIPQEQRFFRNNRLSHYQCFLLDSFLECFAERDAALCAKNNLATVVTNAFTSLGAFNLDVHIGDQNYPLRGVIARYYTILVKSNHSSIECFNNSRDSILSTHNSKIEPNELFFFKTDMTDATVDVFDFLTKEDIESFTSASKTCMSAIAGYARR